MAQGQLARLERMALGQASAGDARAKWRSGFGGVDLDQHALQPRAVVALVSRSSLKYCPGPSRDHGLTQAVNGMLVMRQLSSRAQFARPAYAPSLLYRPSAGTLQAVSASEGEDGGQRLLA